MADLESRRLAPPCTWGGLKIGVSRFAKLRITPGAHACRDSLRTRITRIRQRAPQGVSRMVADSSMFPLESQQQAAGAGIRSRTDINIGELERWASLAGGVLLTILGLTRRSLSGLVLAGAGGALIYRGLTGHCQLYAALGKSTANQSPERQQGVPDQGPDFQ